VPSTIKAPLGSPPPPNVVPAYTVTLPSVSPRQQICTTSAEAIEPPASKHAKATEHTTSLIRVFMRFPQGS
jgi:hypothetical protein